MHDLDDQDPYPPPWYSGPPPRRSPGPVIEAYVDTNALDVECPHCGSAAGDFCHHPAELNAAQRKMPCPKRIRAAAAALAEKAADS